MDEVGMDGHHLKNGQMIGLDRSIVKKSFNSDLSYFLKVYMKLYYNPKYFLFYFYNNYFYNNYFYNHYFYIHIKKMKFN